MFIWLEIWIRVLLSIFWYQEISEFSPIKLAKLVKCAKFSQFFVPKKSLVSMLTWRCPGTWVVARWSHLNRTCKVQDIQGFLKVCGKEINEKKKKESAQKLLWLPHLVHYPMTWKGAKWRQQCLDSFFVGCINTCHRVFRFTTALFTPDELLYQLAPSRWPIKEPTGLFAPHHGKWSWLPIKERVEKEFKELAS